MQLLRQCIKKFTGEVCTIATLILCPTHSKQLCTDRNFTQSGLIIVISVAFPGLSRWVRNSDRDPLSFLALSLAAPLTGFSVGLKML